MQKNNQKIPEGWSVKKLGDIGKVSMCKRIMKYETNPNTGIPFYKIGTFGGKADAYISEALYTEYKSRYSYPKKGDILISAAGTIGRTVVFDGKDSYFQDSNIVWVANDESKALNKYLLYYYTTSPWYTTTGGAISRLYNENISNAQVLLPPLPEQEKIADILGTWDEAIEKLSGLIEQKKLLKKGLMQKLLTGKTRLPGFTQPWKEVKLGKICKLETATSKSAFIDENGKYYIIDMGAVSTECTLISSKRTNACEDLLKINDIVIPKDDIGGGNIIGKTAIIKQENTYVLSDHVFKLNIHDSDANFISYLINSYGYNKYMRRMSCGSAILGLSKKDVEKCLLYIPSDISEQQAIADVLSTADDEINLLNQKLEALKEQKKGLMQQLLTGQIRVKVN